MFYTQNYVLSNHVAPTSKKHLAGGGILFSNPLTSSPVCFDTEEVQ